MSKARDQLHEAMHHENGTYRINAHVTDDIDDAFGPEFEKAIEAAASRSVWSVMKLVARALFTGGKSFEREMEEWAETFEAEMEARGEILEQRGEALCGQMLVLNRLEDEMQKQIPELQGFDLLVVRPEIQHAGAGLTQPTVNPGLPLLRGCAHNKKPRHIDRRGNMSG